MSAIIDAGAHASPKGYLYTILGKKPTERPETRGRERQAGKGAVEAIKEDPTSKRRQDLSQKGA